MKHIRTIVMAGVASVLLAACGSQQAAQPAQSDQSAPAAQAAQPAAPATGDQAAQNPQGGQRGPMLMGQVTAVNGSTLTVQNQMQQTATNVAVTADTQIFKQATINLADAPTGEQISAFGTQQGDVFVASQIRIGVSGGFGGPGGAPPSSDQNGQPPQGNPPQGNPPDGNPPQGAPQGGPNGNGGTRISGTIEQVSANALTIKQADGATVQVQLANDGRMVQQVAATTADITTGTSVMVQGEQNGDTVTATRIELVPQMAQPQ